MSNSVYYPMPDYTSLVLNTGPVDALAIISSPVYTTGYSRVSFWLNLVVPGGSPINSATIQYKSTPEGGAIPVIATGDQYRTDSNTIVAGAYTSDIYLVTVAIVVGASRFLFTVPADGATVALLVTFNSIDVAATYRMFASRLA